MLRIKFSPPFVIKYPVFAIKKVPTKDTNSSVYNRPITGNLHYIMQRKLDDIKNKIFYNSISVTGATVKNLCALQFLMYFFQYMFVLKYF